MSKFIKLKCEKNPSVGNVFRDLSVKRMIRLQLKGILVYVYRMNVLYDGTRDFAPHYLLPLGMEGQDTEQRNTTLTRIQPTYLPAFNQVRFCLIFLKLFLCNQNGISQFHSAYYLPTASVGWVEVMFLQVCLSLCPHGGWRTPASGPRFFLGVPQPLVPCYHVGGLSSSLTTSPLSSWVMEFGHVLN